MMAEQAGDVLPSGEGLRIESMKRRPKPQTPKPIDSKKKDANVRGGANGSGFGARQMLQARMFGRN